MANNTYSQDAFSILIPTWNNLAYLQCCVDSIRKNSNINHQIIVHVNEGFDGTLDWVQEQHIDFTFSESNIGICKALNNASKLATTNYICYMNDDMYVLPNWDSLLIEEIKKINTSLFFVSATMIEPKGNNVCAISPFDFGTNLDQFQEKQILETYTTYEKQNWNGASWPPNVVHISTWKKVGGYSEEFSPGLYSDPDFARKLWQIGVRQFMGVGKSRVYHFQSKSLGRIKLNNGKKTYCKKWNQTPSFLYKKVLKIGSLYTGNLPEKPTPIHIKLKALWYSMK